MAGLCEGSNESAGSLKAIYKFSAICDMEPSLGEFGVYDFVISNAGSGVMCSLVTRKKPVNIYLPLVLWLLVLLAIWFLYGLVSTIVIKWFKHKKNQTASASDTQQSSNRQRLKSLDTFRG
ncbi:hypothetical protein ANN_11487 [Periplaneta americana]|uniref:Uncharacterized protein n=1 Tax=Periplaneta americana TaxID=6978 RepID=A0ABQ8T551_PERAM|nr:hypothetical protein ANN_11487 [Periplaneta americana]